MRSLCVDGRTRRGRKKKQTCPGGLLLALEGPEVLFRAARAEPRLPPRRALALAHVAGRGDPAKAARGAERAALATELPRAGERRVDARVDLVDDDLGLAPRLLRGQHVERLVFVFFLPFALATSVATSVIEIVLVATAATDGFVGLRGFVGRTRSLHRAVVGRHGREGEQPR